MDAQVRLTGGTKFGADGMNNVALLLMLLVGYVALPSDLKTIVMSVLLLYALQNVLFRGTLWLSNNGRNWVLRQAQAWLFIYTIAGFSVLVFKGTVFPFLEYALGGVFLTMVLSMMQGGNS